MLRRYASVSSRNSSTDSGCLAAGRRSVVLRMAFHSSSACVPSSPIGLSARCFPFDSSTDAMPAFVQADEASDGPALNATALYRPAICAEEKRTYRRGEGRCSVVEGRTLESRDCLPSCIWMMLNCGRTYSGKNGAKAAQTCPSVFALPPQTSSEIYGQMCRMLIIN